MNETKVTLINRPAFDDVLKERDQLRAENERLREALSSISWYRQWYEHKHITEKIQIEHDLDVIIRTAEQALKGWRGE